jgi:hypothetical protein
MPVMAVFTLAHLSDPHLAPLPATRLRDLAGKRAFGYLNWTRNRHNSIAATCSTRLCQT